MTGTQNSSSNENPGDGRDANSHGHGGGGQAPAAKPIDKIRAVHRPAGNRLAGDNQARSEIRPGAIVRADGAPGFQGLLLILAGIIPYRGRSRV